MARLNAYNKENLITGSNIWQSRLECFETKPFIPNFSLWMDLVWWGSFKLLTHQKSLFLLKFSSNLLVNLFNIINGNGFILSHPFSLCDYNLIVILTFFIHQNMLFQVMSFDIFKSRFAEITNTRMFYCWFMTVLMNKELCKPTEALLALNTLEWATIWSSGVVKEPPVALERHCRQGEYFVNEWNYSDDEDLK